MQWLPLSRHSAQTSPGTTRFFLSIHPLHLPYMIPCSYRASACKAVLPSCIAFYVISVRQTGDLPVVSLFPHPASFRFHLAMDTLTFGYILPTTGRIRDLHPLETCAAGRTLNSEQYQSYLILFFCTVPFHYSFKLGLLSTYAGSPAAPQAGSFGSPALFSCGCPFPMGP